MLSCPSRELARRASCQLRSRVLGDRASLAPDAWHSCFKRPRLVRHSALGNLSLQTSRLQMREHTSAHDCCRRVLGSEYSEILTGAMLRALLDLVEKQPANQPHDKLKACDWAAAIPGPRRNPGTSSQRPALTLRLRRCFSLAVWPRC